MNRKHPIPKPSPVRHRQWHEEEATVREGAGGTRVSPQWPWHYKSLLSLRGRILDNREDQALEASEAIETHPTAPAETGTDAFDHDMSFALLANEEDMLREIDAALTRIATGTYGICEESGERISAARLRAIPWTRYTKDVAERLEHEENSSGPHLGVLRSVNGKSLEALSDIEETDEIALAQAGEGRMTDAGPGEDIDNLTEEDALTSPGSDPRT